LRHRVKIKNIADNTTIKGIGPLFRRHGDPDWKVDLLLEPPAKKNFLDISDLPQLALRRILNPNQHLKTAGYSFTIPVINSASWIPGQFLDCSVRGAFHPKYEDQLCFRFQQQGIDFYLPQIELARALFFRNAYYSRLSMVENGLSLEFDISNSDDSAVGIVNILPICKMPEESRRSQSSLQFLAWLLFDQNARASFESIYINQIQNGNDTAQYRRWMFEFDQPQLSGVELSVHGIFDKKKNQFFIWEINAIEKLYCDIPQEIVFIDPHFSTSLSGGVGGASQSGTNIPDFELDDDQTPDVDLKLIEIDSPTMCFEFKNPPSIKRVGTGHSRSVKGSNPTGKVELAPTVVDVSTLESSVLGTARPADYSGTDSWGRDVEVSVYSLQLFNMMLGQIAERMNIIHTSAHELPVLNGFTKGRMADGQSRIILVNIVRIHALPLVLLEVDTSDCQGQLSTMLLIPRFDINSDKWRSELRNLETKLIKQSLNWPTDYFKKTMLVSSFGSNIQEKSLQHPVELNGCDNGVNVFILQPCQF
jgi:hypothetical protein